MISLLDVVIQAQHWWVGNTVWVLVATDIPSERLSVRLFLGIPRAVLRVNYFLRVNPVFKGVTSLELVSNLLLQFSAFVWTLDVVLTVHFHKDSLFILLSKS